MVYIFLFTKTDVINVIKQWNSEGLQSELPYFSRTGNENPVAKLKDVHFIRKDKMGTLASAVSSIKVGRLTVLSFDSFRV